MLTQTFVMLICTHILFIPYEAMRMCMTGETSLKRSKEIVRIDSIFHTSLRYTGDLLPRAKNANRSFWGVSFF